MWHDEHVEPKWPRFEWHDWQAVRDVCDAAQERPALRWQLEQAAEYARCPREWHEPQSAEFPGWRKRAERQGLAGEWHFEHAAP